MVFFSKPCLLNEELFPYLAKMFLYIFFSLWCENKCEKNCVQRKVKQLTTFFFFIYAYFFRIKTLVYFVQLAPWAHTDPESYKYERKIPLKSVQNSSNQLMVHFSLSLPYFTRIQRARCIGCTRARALCFGFLSVWVGLVNQVVVCWYCVFSRELLTGYRCH